MRRRFAVAWGRMGEAWGVAPSTAAVQGYLLVHGGPLTEAEIQAALGFSHRAIRIALAECEAWGILERAPEPRRSGQRGPAGTAWVPIDDHWEWFRRVSGARKEREGDPAVRLLEQCLEEARGLRPGGAELTALQGRLQSMIEFVHAFDHALAAVVRTESAALGRMFRVLARLDDRSLDRLLSLMAALPEAELAQALRTLSGLPPRIVRRLLQVLGRPAIARLIARRVGTRN